MWTKILLLLLIGATTLLAAPPEVRFNFPICQRQILASFAAVRLDLKLKVASTREPKIQFSHSVIFYFISRFE